MIQLSQKRQKELGDLMDKYIEELKYCLNKLERKNIAQIITILVQAYRRKKKVFIVGNGGSAANASHMACDFSKGTLKRVYDEKEDRFRVYSLTDNVATITAFGNDLSYEDIFMQQLRNLIEKGDILIVLSASGNSPNVVKAVNYARRCGAKTVGILGFKTGGKLAQLVDFKIVIQSTNYGICEDIQLILDHILTSWLAKVKHEL